MIVIGVVGGIASGKSFVTRQLKSYGAVVLDADRIGHEVLLREPVKARIRKHWGEEVFLPNGEVNRSALASLVFDPDHPEQLHQLEAITHPLIADELRAEISRLRDSGDLLHLVLDAPVMVKAGWYVVCDVIIFVEASLEIRWQRASLRGWTREMFDNRESMQATTQEKRQVSSFVVDNNGTRDETERQVNEIWERINTKTIPHH